MVSLNKIQIAHPDHIIPPEKEAEMPRFEAVYPRTAGLTPKTPAKAMKAALSACLISMNGSAETALIVSATGMGAATQPSMPRVGS